MLKNIFMIMIGCAIGYGVSATRFFTSERTLVRVDAVTLHKHELHHVTEAISLIAEAPIGKSYPRYESNSGTVAFECPTDESCNLIVSARPRVEAVMYKTPISGVNKEPQADQRQVSPAAIDAAKASMSQLLEAARAVPSRNSVYDSLTVKQGDVETRPANERE